MNILLQVVMPTMTADITLVSRDLLTCSNLSLTLRRFAAYVKRQVSLVGKLTIRAHSFPRQNLTNSAANLVNSAAHRSKADEIPRQNLTNSAANLVNSAAHRYKADEIPQLTVDT